MKKKTKRKIVVGSLAVLSAAAVTLVSAAVATALRKPKDISETPDDAVEALIGSFTVEEKGEGAPMPLSEELEPQIQEIIDDISARCGGEWSVYLTIPATGDTLSMNPKKLRAASVIKLFVMGAVYEEYDDLVKYYAGDDIPESIEAMITISSNEDADLLVMMLGRGDAAVGLKKVNDYCKAKGFENTKMGRLMGVNDEVNDNITTAEDSAKFLEMVLQGELPHSKDMIKYLMAQDRRNKIPEGVPKNVKCANKTGELEDVENDAAIVFAAKPYILCVMADGVGDYQPPIDAISDISTVTYNYVAPKVAYQSSDE